MFHGRGYAVEILHRSQANVEIEHLAQGDVQGADTATDRRREGAFNANQKFSERFDRVIRQPVVELVFGRLSGEHLEPGDLAFATVRLLHRGIEHALAGVPDVGAGAVAPNEWKDGIIRNVKFAVGNGDCASRWWSRVFVGHCRRFEILS